MGKEYRLLIDRWESGKFVGRTEHDSPEVDNEVLVDGDSGYLRLGDFCTVRITHAQEFDLMGEVVADPTALPLPKN